MQFTPFLTLLAEIEDPRRAEGKLYRLPHVVLFAILAMVAGANSYRSIHSFVDVNFVRLRKFFKLKWRRTPAYTTIFSGSSTRLRSSKRSAAMPPSLTSKRLRRASGTSPWTARHCGKASTPSRTILSAFASASTLVLAHLDCDEKSNEIPAVQALLRQLGLEETLLTVDAMHC